MSRQGLTYWFALWSSAGLLLTGIIRYSCFGMKEALGFTPSWLLIMAQVITILYSTFLLLYPTGITSEVGLIYIALPYIKKQHKSSDKFCFRMPNKWNFSFDYYFASLAVLGIYVPGSPHMYTYMLGQRKKALSKLKAA
ncbi:Very-long-chain (3R)-3-hydroxyacyl-CoA dehydratase [Rhynchospora pubera]|uniref:Very-long-chain (3R)-3-hydroxyacyl-CoA dehydratase n=1 Tax=Rhynchospora pubera TaxID=906938 RepID=A0AAV8GT08_9POAL|nr:Very-long-chain (3R)-3-hydroxyacyl-CoA dehydratase [Rhynchospora pubera]